jgi:hypothetical protein
MMSGRLTEEHENYRLGLWRGHSCLPRRDSSRRLLDFRAFSEEALGLVRWYKPVSSSE